MRTYFLQAFPFFTLLTDVLSSTSKDVSGTLRRHNILLTFLPLDKTEEVRRLGMGLLLSDLSRKMSRKVKLGDQDPVKILVHSTHDTAIAALCSTLDVYDELCALPFLEDKLQA